MERERITQRRRGRRGFAEKKKKRERPATVGGPYKRKEEQEGGNDRNAWDDCFAAAGGDCGVAARVDWVVGDWVAGWVVSGKDGARAWVWVYWGYFDWVDRVGDWRMDFYAGGDW